MFYRVIQLYDLQSLNVQSVLQCISVIFPSCFMTLTIVSNTLGQQPIYSALSITSFAILSLNLLCFITSASYIAVHSSVVLVYVTIALLSVKPVFDKHIICQLLFMISTQQGNALLPLNA